MSNVRAHVTHIFTLTPEDFSSFQRQVGKLVRKRLPRGWGFLLQVVVWLFIGLAVSTYLRVYENAFEHRRALALAGGLVVAAAVMFVFAQVLSGRLVQRHLHLKTGPLLSPQSLTVGDEGLLLVTMDGRVSSKYAWNSFIGRAEDDRNFYLFLDPGYAIILPKSSMADASEHVVRERVNEL